MEAGDLVSLSGKVQEYRSSSYPTYLLATELSSPSNITVLSSNNTVKPIVLGVDRSPPTQYLSALDVGRDGFLSVSGNQSRVDTVNATVLPTKYGLDFWSSLEGQLVTIPKPVSLGFENTYGEFWVRGNWKATGVNARGGLSLVLGELLLGSVIARMIQSPSAGPNGVPDAGPESVIIGSPIDGTKNPAMCVGKTLSDVTGVVQYQCVNPIPCCWAPFLTLQLRYGFYYVLPLTAPTVLSTPDSTVPPTKLTSSTSKCVVTLGDYNVCRFLLNSFRCLNIVAQVENMGPDSSHLPVIATHITDYLRTPDIMFLQEIQDNSGETDDGTVDANVTLSTLASAIASQSAITYNFTEVISVDGQDGGVPGGNIRPAYL